MVLQKKAGLCLIKSDELTERPVVSLRSLTAFFFDSFAIGDDGALPIPCLGQSEPSRFALAVFLEYRDLLWVRESSPRRARSRRDAKTAGCCLRTFPVCTWSKQPSERLAVYTD